MIPPDPLSKSCYARSNRLRRRNHQPSHGRTCLHAQFGLDDLRLQARGREQLLDVGPGMTVTAVQFQAETGVGAVAGRVLKRKHQEPIRAQGFSERSNDTLQVAEIHQRIRRHDQVERFAIVAQVLAQLGS